MTQLDNDDSYATQERLAIYLEAGWSDFLLGAGNDKSSDEVPGYPNPVVNYVPPDFPRAVARLAKQLVTDTGLDAKRYADVGGATGRTVYEVDHLFPEMTSLVLVEPSEIFCDWATRFLASDVDLPDIPVVDVPGVPKFIKPRSRPSSISDADRRLSIHNQFLEDHNPRDGYDLVTCLNVVDRHPQPLEVVVHFERFMNEGGLLLMSCPFDFHEGSTPDRANWISDLNSLFEGRSWEHVGEYELYYEYRGHRRSWTRLTAQLVGKRWIN